MTEPVSPREAGIEVAAHITTTPPATLEVVGVRHGAFGALGSGDTSGFGGLVSPIVMPGPTAAPAGVASPFAAPITTTRCAAGGRGGSLIG